MKSQFLTPFILCILLFSGASAEVKKQPLVIYEIVKDCPVILKDEYGVMLINDGGEKDPSPRYVFARLSTRTVLDTKNFAEFQHALSRLPKGSTIYQYGSCTVPRSYGLTKKHFDAYQNLFKKLKLKVSEEPRLTCYCKKVSS